MQKLCNTSLWPVYGQVALRRLETRLQASSRQPLMQLAGLAAARLALAIAPHARYIWIAAGPGNNGGDGLEAALHLHHWGKQVVVSWMGSAAHAPSDAFMAWQRANAAGVNIQLAVPEAWLTNMNEQDLCIDALLGLGANRALSPEMQARVRAIHQCPGQVLALDGPTGLDLENGQWLGGAEAENLAVHADHTLTYIAAKPGLFMGHGRDACGQIWLDDLGLRADDRDAPPQAWLNAACARPIPSHASHKGSHGDVAVIGGESMTLNGMGMTGAAVLAATAALHAGAGRVILSLLSGQTAEHVPPDLMQRDWQGLNLERMLVVCGCGGGQAIRTRMPEVLQRSAQLVLDADGLNAVAQDRTLQSLLSQRAEMKPTVITPHPLEAARLLKTSTAQVQHNRLQAAKALADMFQCTVVLKGSGTVIAAPGQTSRINTSGNGRLATGGTGDVLAGLIGARMAQGLKTFDAACSAVAQHGQAANDWPDDRPLTASALAHHLH
jgi:ADP-dependent NAD(P)H-hydrate dehydratase / NAD(P)H-hydrate epimerase